MDAFANYANYNSSNNGYLQAKNDPPASGEKRTEKSMTLRMRAKTIITNLFFELSDYTKLGGTIRSFEFQ